MLVKKGRSKVIGGEEQDFFPWGKMGDKTMRGHLCREEARCKKITQWSDEQGIFWRAVDRIDLDEELLFKG